MGRDEVDARHRAASRVLVVVGRSRQSRGELAQRRLAAPEVADGVAVGAVPLGPLGREVADLVAARADVPRLGDQLHLADDRVLLHELEEGRQPVDVVELARQRGRQVEAEPVDVHLGHPVAQGVHDQLQRVGLAHVEGVPGAGVVHVVAGVVLHQPVVRRVVDALEAQRRTEVVALRGVVVDDVEDDLDAGGVHGAHHLLELLHLLADLVLGVGGAGVLLVRREEAEGVVAPVVAQPLLLQRAVVHELVDGHQLERRDAELGEVVGDRGVGEAGVRAAQLLGDLGVQLGEPLDVSLVDQALVVGDVEAAVALPVEERVDDDAVQHVGGRVVVVARVGVAEVVAVQRLVPVDGAGRGLGVGVEQQLVRVEPQAVLGLVRAVHAVAVALAGLDGRQVAVPDEAVDLGQLDARLGAGRSVEQAELDALCVLAEDREVGAAAVERRPQRVGAAGPGLHVLPFVLTYGCHVRHSCVCRAHGRPVPRLDRSKHSVAGAASSR